MVPGVVLGQRVGPFAGVIDVELLRAYAAATHDSSPSVTGGLSVPPTALVTQIWDAQNDGRVTLVPEALQRAATGGVHGEHDIVLHRPIAPGEQLQTWVEGHGSRPVGRNSAVTLRYVTNDAQGAIVTEQWWTTIFLGTSCDVVGEAAPDHAFPPEAREHLLGLVSRDVDAATARRYASVSGDWSAHHFELEAAQRSGVDRVFLHGLCTMAICTSAVASVAADGDPSRLRRVAVRFAAPMFMDERLEVRVYDAGDGAVAFEAECAGVAVITHGRAELR